jgi:hypothetical protein
MSHRASAISRVGVVGLLLVGSSCVALRAAAAPPVTSGLVVWFDPSDPTAVITDGSGRVSFLLDKAGGNNADQFTPNLQPLLVNSAINGKTGLGFDDHIGGDGVADYLVGTAPPIGPNTPFTYFVAVKPVAFTAGGITDGSGTYFIDRTSATNNLVCLKVVNGNKYGFQVRYDDGSGLGGPISTTPVSTVASQILTLRRNYDETPGGANDFFELYVNNVLESQTADAGSGLTPPAPQIGRHATIGTGGFEGAMGEILIYDRALSPAEMTAVTTYLANVPEPGVVGLVLAAGVILCRARRRGE